MNISRMQEAGYDLARERLLVTFRNVIRGANQSGSKSLSPLVNGKAYLISALWRNLGKVSQWTISTSRRAHWLHCIDWLFSTGTDSGHIESFELASGTGSEGHLERA